MTGVTTRRREGVVQILLNLDRGGMESMAVGLAIALRERGVASSIVALDAGGEHEDALTRAGVPYDILGGRRWARPERHARLIMTLRASRPHAVHTHHFAPLLHSVLAIKWCRIPRLVHTEHSFQYLEPRRDYQRTLRALSWACDRFVVVGGGMEDYYRNAVRVPGDRLLTIRNGVPLGAAVRASDRSKARGAAGLPDGFLVGTAGRFFPEKDYVTLLRAVSMARRHHASLHLVMIGDGPLRAMLESTATELGMRDAVTFTGWRPDVTALLPLLDVFALTSLSEGLPLVVLEAMAAGLPVVTTPVGDLPEVLAHGAAGRLFPVGDAGALARVLTEVAGDPEQLGRLACAAREQCEREYSHGRMVSRYLEAYGLAT